MTAPTEIGSATGELWARKEAVRKAQELRTFALRQGQYDRERAERKAESAVRDAENRRLADRHKPWVQDAIRKWWKGEEKQ